MILNEETVRILEENTLATLEKRFGKSNGDDSMTMGIATIAVHATIQTLIEYQKMNTNNPNPLAPPEDIS